jgi:hypothetical protein
MQRKPGANYFFESVSGSGARAERRIAAWQLSGTVWFGNSSATGFA